MSLCNAPILALQKTSIGSHLLSYPHTIRLRMDLDLASIWSCPNICVNPQISRTQCWQTPNTHGECLWSIRNMCAASRRVFMYGIKKERVDIHMWTWFANKVLFCVISFVRKDLKKLTACYNHKRWRAFHMFCLF